MTVNDYSPADSNSTASLTQWGPLGSTIATGLFCWAAISVGFFGLKFLMQERPQFVGEPMRTSKAVLIQESPQIVTRKVTDDISVIKPMQPESSDVRFDMKGRRDYRGLKTIIDMSGEFHATHLLTNAFEEASFVLFKCPLPKTESGHGQSLLAGGLKLQAAVPGVQENAGDAWYWSGTLAGHSSVRLDISYQVASLKGLTYRVGEQNGNPVKQLRVSFHRQDLPSMRFESGDGMIPAANDTVAWERENFLAPDLFSAEVVASRNLYTSLSQLMEIGPLIALLFLLTVSAVILVRQPLTVVQVCTISACYALYFPLILYLSSRFSFAVALVLAVVVPGVLLLNYARWLLGGKLALMGGLVLLLLFQVFPTLAAFSGWNRGMVLLCLGVVTLWVLINLQNQALRRKTAAAALILLTVLPCRIDAAEIQVVLPGELAERLQDTNPTSLPALIAFQPVDYQARLEGSHLRVEATIPLQVIRPAHAPVPLFGAPVYMSESRLEPAEPPVARLVTLTNQLRLFAQKEGQETLHLVYRVPVENREGKKRVQIPVVVGSSGNVRLESTRSDLEVLTGSLWSKTTADKTVTYDIGVAGQDLLVLEWREQGADETPPVTAQQAAGSRQFYGIGLTRAQNLTVINSDGSCTHFAEFELPVSQTDEFRLRLPEQTRLISVSVDGTEINSPPVEDRLCRLRLPVHETGQAAHRLSFRLAYPAVRLGFVGTLELRLPEVFQTAGILEWVVALPNGFETQVISSGLETQKSQPDLSRFGDYGRILIAHPRTCLAKNLAPPGPVNLNLKYRQLIPAIYGEERSNLQTSNSSE